MDKRAFILTLEIVVGSALVFGLVFVSLFFLNRESAGIGNIQLLRFGSDVVTLLDNQNAFDSLDSQIIQTRMQEIVPRNYALLLRIKGNFSEGNGTMEVGDELPEKETALVGKGAALTEDNVYLQITYWVAPRGE